MKKHKFKCTIHSYCRVLIALVPFIFNVEIGFSQSEKTYEVKGVIVDGNDNTPLVGATIQVENSSIGAATDFDGNYTLKIPESAEKILISHMGYYPITISFKPEKLDVFRVIQMFEDEQSLDEVTIVAFGTQKKESIISSISTIKPSGLRTSNGNLTTALAGRVAGLVSYQRSGEPGLDNAEFFIRGVTTFGYKRDPLILIDGIESSTTSLSRLQPDDIESFSIMKDATATALYGSRAANGVILVKTKEGIEGQVVVQLRVENSLSMPTRNIELADPITYMRLHNEAVKTRDGLSALPYTQEKIDRTIAGVNPYVYPVTDWRKELIKDYTMNQNANINVRGGGKVARYYVAGAFNQNNGLLKVDKRNDFNNNINLKTYSLRSNVNIDLTETTKMDVRLSGVFDEYKGPIGGGAKVYGDVMKTNPVLFPAFYPADEEHSYVEHIMFGNFDGGSGFYLNPYAEMVKGYREYSRSTMSAQLQLSQELSFITEGLKMRTMINTLRKSFFEVSRSYRPFWYQATSYNKLENTYNIIGLNEDSGTEYLDYTPGTRQVESSFYLESAIDYSRKFKDIHEITGLFVFMAQNRLNGNATTLQHSLPYKNVGLAGRATYGYDSRYFVELNFGYNASERFHKSNRWGFFPSAGIAWNVANEKFFEKLTGTISSLKLRATHGLSGNDAIGGPDDRFLYLSNVNMSDSSRGAAFGTNNGYRRSGISISRYSDPLISWEESQKSNIGIEMGLFNELNILVDLYKEQRTNILQTRASIPQEMGLTADPKANVGKAIGSGIDISLDYSKSFNNGFWLQGRANMTYAKSEYKVIEEYDYQDAYWRSRIGYSLNQEWGYLAERLFVDDIEAANSPKQNFGEYGGGDIKYRDINDDGQITELDLVPIGFPTIPEIVYGFGFSLGVKNFDLSMFFQGIARESFWIDADKTAPFIGEKQLLKAYANDHWSEENQNIYALWPRLTATEAGSKNNSQRSTWFMRDGSFLRLKQIEVGYSLPESILSKLYMTSCRFYITSTNPVLWSKFKLWDVEMGGNGLGYPIQKAFNLGANFSF
ncbi:SusC/RagA family TonB-linked outer membrane protein [Flavivirga eckloniae]|uniref:SusC/RagA family TonB-linked outer membrane protein n=1 Tax=Flavivirga eckloniae TaxID=1803846 RepID=A0A2K9PM49_9FLAO|nr:TonB-dependent receptor [Flavivirga eckloniae]AUP77918.1 SusC/RagA family TonB-linked outer membrane protein [Flavivirga eckloniae]